jgi:hypothetical protein
MNVIITPAVPAAPVPNAAQRLPIVVDQKNPAEYPIVVAQGGADRYPIRIITPNGTALAQPYRSAAPRMTPARPTFVRPAPPRKK